MSEAALPGDAPGRIGVAALLSDEWLARRAAAGDERALAAIFSRYQQGLYRFCLAIVGDSQDAQDALQNAMVKMLRSLPGEERRIELKPWLYRIAHNESVELLRRRRPSEELEEQPAARGADLSEDVAVRERLRRLIADLEQLPERQRGALVMRELSGLDYDEIAAALGTTPAVARQTLYEARLSLRQMDEGREMECAAVTRALSDADGRVARRRDIRAHLRACSECRRFRAELEGRRDDLAALSPLPAVAAAGLLQGLFGGAGSGGAGAVGALGGSGAGTLGAATALKSAAAIAVVAAAGIGVADRAGVVDVAPFGGGNAQQAKSQSERPASGSAPAPTAGGAAGAVQSAAVREASAAGGGGSVEAKPPTAQAGSGLAPSGLPSAATAPASEPHPHGRGHEKQHPSAADHGQQTAASNKATGKGSGKSGGRPDKAHPSHPTKPAKPPKPTKQQTKPSKEPKEAKPPKSSRPTKDAQQGSPAGGKEGAPKKAPAEPADAASPPPETLVPPEEAPDKGHGSAFQP
jgi:RNA polymerase sigma factor (sigma-70 family)